MDEEANGRGFRAEQELFSIMTFTSASGLCSVKEVNDVCLQYH